MSMNTNTRIVPQHAIVVAVMMLCIFCCECSRQGKSYVSMPTDKERLPEPCESEPALLLDWSLEKWLEMAPTMQVSIVGCDVIYDNVIGGTANRLAHCMGVYIVGTETGARAIYYDTKANVIYEKGELIEWHTRFDQDEWHDVLSYLHHSRIRKLRKCNGSGKGDHIKITAGNATVLESKGDIYSWSIRLVDDEILVIGDKIKAKSSSRRNAEYQRIYGDTIQEFENLISGVTFSDGNNAINIKMIDVDSITYEGLNISTTLDIGDWFEIVRTLANILQKCYVDISEPNDSLSWEERIIDIAEKEGLNISTIDDINEEGLDILRTLIGIQRECYASSSLWEELNNRILRVIVAAKKNPYAETDPSILELMQLELKLMQLEIEAYGYERKCNMFNDPIGKIKRSLRSIDPKDSVCMSAWEELNEKLINIFNKVNNGSGVETQVRRYDNVKINCLGFRDTIEFRK